MASCTYDYKGQGALRRRKDRFKREKRKVVAEHKTKTKVENPTKPKRRQGKIHRIGRQKTAVTQDDMTTTRDSDDVLGDVILELCRECKELSTDVCDPEPLPPLDPLAVEDARRLGLKKVAEDIVFCCSRRKCPYGHYDDDDGSEDFSAELFDILKSSEDVKEDTGEWGNHY